MAVAKLPDGRWRVDVEPVKGRRFRKIFATRGEAVRYESHVKAQAYQPEWMPTKKDVRKLSDLIRLWYDLHGLNLRDHVKTLSRLERMAAAQCHQVKRCSSITRSAG